VAITPQFNTGWEHGLASSNGIGLGTYTVATVTGGAARNGSFGLHVAKPLNNAVNWVPPVSNNAPFAKAVVRFAVLVSSRPSSANARIFYTTGSATIVVTVDSTGLLAAGPNGATQNGPTIDTTSFHLIELQIDLSGNPWKVDWKVDGVAQTQATSAVAASTTTNYNLGSALTTEPAYTADFDDFIYGTFTGSSPSATEWFGDGAGEWLSPSVDGTHTASSGQITEGDAGATSIVAATTNAFSFVDDAPPWSTTRSTTDNWAGRVNAVVHAACKPVGPSGLPDANAVQALVAYSSSATQSNNAWADVKGPAGTEEAVFGMGTSSRAGAIDFSDATNDFHSGQITASGAWTKANIDLIEFWFGPGTDISPVPTVQMFGLEIDRPVIPPAVITPASADMSAGATAAVTAGSPGVTVTPATVAASAAATAALSPNVRPATPAAVAAATSLVTAKQPVVPATPAAAAAATAAVTIPTAVVPATPAAVAAATSVVSAKQPVVPATPAAAAAATGALSPNVTPATPAAVSAATNLVTIPAAVVPGTPTGAAAATTVVSAKQPMVPATAAAIATATAALSPNVMPGTPAGAASATALVTVPGAATVIPGTVAAAGAASAVVSATQPVAPATVAGVAAATAALSPLVLPGTATGAASASTTVSAKQPVVPGTAAGAAAATAALSPLVLPGTATAAGAATATVSATQPVAPGTPAGVASASAALSPTLHLGTPAASATTSATVARAEPVVPGTAAATATGSATVTAPGVVFLALGTPAGAASASAAITARTLLTPGTAAATASTSATVSAKQPVIPSMATGTAGATMILIGGSEQDGPLGHCTVLTLDARVTTLTLSDRTTFLTLDEHDTTLTLDEPATSLDLDDC
jgi:hypothetical protein